MKVNIYIFATIVLILTTLVTTGCGKDDPQLTVLCGSSFIKPTERLCVEFTAKTGIYIAMSAAGSEDFLPLVKAGKQGDILVTHDPYLDEGKEAGALADHVHTGFVAPVLVVQKGNPKNIKSIDDLTRPGLKIALSNPRYSTCGEMVAALLEKKGIKEAVMKNVGTRLTKGHSTLGTYIKTKVVDVVIMWNGVADVFGEDLQIVPTPYEYENDIRVHVIGLSYSKYPERLKKFFDFVRERGPAIFAEHGYVK